MLLLIPDTLYFKTPMKKVVVFISSFAIVAGHYSCSAQLEGHSETSEHQTDTTHLPGNTISTRFEIPKGYSEMKVEQNSFAEYLRNLPLKTENATVTYFDGRTKINRSVYCAVIDQDIDPVDLQQCADAVMRLRGEYLFSQKRYSDIHFSFLSDGKPRYFRDYANGDYSYSKFRKYMKYIFSYANTASLKKELKPVSIISSIEIGDVFIQSGNPYGHAVIVVNLIEDENGNKKMMLAQSYMPAQETQVLLNPNAENSPWYDVKEGALQTPEWNFHSSDLRRF